MDPNKHSDLVTHWYERCLNATLMHACFIHVMFVIIFHKTTRTPLCFQIILSFTTFSHDPQISDPLLEAILED